MANYTSVTASNICDAAGNKLASGTVSFQATDASNQPIPFQVGGGGQVVTTPAVFTITNGAIAGGAQVADSANTTPAGILYRIVITDTTLNRVVATYSLVTVTGTTFNLDNYSQTGIAVLPPTGGSVNGPLSVNGNLSVTGSFGTIQAHRLNNIRFADDFATGSLTGGIQEAINDLGVNGGLVWLPLGTTTCSATITVPSNVTLQGFGKGLTTLKTANSSATGFAVLKNSTQSGSGNSNLCFRDFTIDGNKSNQVNTGQMGFQLHRVSKVLFLNVEVQNTTGNAASGFQVSDPASLDNTPNTDITFAFCDAHDCGLSAVNNADGFAIGGVRIKFIGCTSRNNTDTGFGLQGRGTSEVFFDTCVADGNTGGGGIAAGPGTLGTDNTNIHIVNCHIVSGNAWCILLQNVKGFEIKGGFCSNTVGAGTPNGAIELDNCQDGLVDTRVIGAVLNCLYIYADGTNVVKNIQVRGEYTYAQQNGIKLIAAAVGATVQDIDVSAVVKNNSQSAANAYDGFVCAVTGTMKFINIHGGSYSDDQGSPTQRYGVNLGGGALSQSGVYGPVVTGNVSGAFNGITADTRLIPAQTGNSSSATSGGDALQLGDNVNMPNSSSRTATFFGRDAGGNFRAGIVRNSNGTDFWIGFADGSGGLHIDLNAGKVELIAEGANQPINLTPTGSGSVVCGTNLVVKSAAPTVSANQLGIGSTTATTVGAAGAASSLPANPVGYLIINVGGTTMKIPYYNN